MIDLADLPREELAQLAKALAHEQAMRAVMEDTGEDRETVQDVVDASDSMGQEAVLVLTEGQPTTLQDALSRYVDTLAAEGGEWPTIMADLDTLLHYPWPGEEALIQLHEGNTWVTLDIRHPAEDRMEVWVGGTFLFAADSEHHTHPGLIALERAAQTVHRDVLARVIADRPHHVQLNKVQTQDLRDWLARPNGALSNGGRLSFNAVEGGGVIVRTQPLRYDKPGNHKGGGSIR